MNYAYQQVTCRDCGDTYVCTPDRDYYAGPDEPWPADAQSGRCFTCLLAAHDFTPTQPAVVGYVSDDGSIEIAEQPEGRLADGSCKDCNQRGRAHKPGCPQLTDEPFVRRQP